jgi:oligopeptide transport system substrate-binding protein
VRRNSHYWGADAVRLDGIDFYPIDNQQTEERSFRTGELHITSTIPLDKVDRYRQDNPEVLNIHPYLGIYFYRMNVTRPPFTDPRVRRAFNLSLDRETLTRDVLTGDEPPAYHFTPPGITGYNPKARVTPDLEEARRLLAEAGYPDGRGLPPVDLLYNTAESHKRIAEAVQRIWKERLNVEVRLMNQDWKVYLSSLNSLDYGMARSAWVADVVYPINFLECFLTGGGNNRTGWSSPEFDSLIQSAYAENDPVQRHGLFEQAEAILLEEAPVIPIYFYTWKYLKAPQVQGLTPNVLGYMKWKEIYLNGGS